MFKNYLLMFTSVPGQDPHVVLFLPLQSFLSIAGQDETVLLVFRDVVPQIGAGSLVFIVVWSTSEVS